MTPPPIPPFDAAHVQSVQDAERLRLLSLFYYIFAGLLAVSGLVFVFHIIMGLAFVSTSFGPTPGVTFSPNTFPGAPPNFPAPSGSFAPPNFPAPPSGSFAPPSSAMPPAFGWLFVFAGVLALLATEILAVLTFAAGRCLVRRRNQTLIQVVAALLCLHVPLGTLLGVFTFIILGRPSIASLFGAPSRL